MLNHTVVVGLDGVLVIFGWIMWPVLALKIVYPHVLRTVLDVTTVTMEKMLEHDVIVSFECFMYIFDYIIIARDTSSCTSGSLRLWSAYNHPENEGMLQICKSGVWYGVCHYYYYCYIAKLACKQMGYSGALSELSQVLIYSYWTSFLL